MNTIVARLRSTAFDLALLIWTMLFSIGILWFSVFGITEPTIRRVTRIWARGLLLGLRWIVGLRHVELGQRIDAPCLIVSNHQSTWETLAFLVLFPDLAIVAKKELLRIPILGWYLRRSPMIIIDRESGRQSYSLMLAQSREALAQGRSVLIFPEGSRKGPQDPVKLKRGAGLLYAQLGVPALPVAHNSGEFWKAGRSGLKLPGEITVSLLPEIAPGLSESEFTKAAETALENERRRISAHAG